MEELASASTSLHANPDRSYTTQEKERKDPNFEPVKIMIGNRIWRGMFFFLDGLHQHVEQHLYREEEM